MHQGTSLFTGAVGSVKVVWSMRFEQVKSEVSVGPLFLV